MKETKENDDKVSGYEYHDKTVVLDDKKYDGNNDSKKHINHNNCSEDKIENCIKVNDDEYEEETDKFNTWYYEKIDVGKYSKASGKTAKKLYEKVDPEASSNIGWDFNQEHMYKQLLGGGNNVCDL